MERKDYSKIIWSWFLVHVFADVLQKKAEIEGLTVSFLNFIALGLELWVGRWREGKGRRKKM